MNRKEFTLITASSLISAILAITFQDVLLTKFFSNRANEDNVSIYYRTANEETISIVFLNDSEETIDLTMLSLEGSIRGFENSLGALVLPAVTYQVNQDDPSGNVEINIDQTGKITLAVDVLLSIPSGGRDVVNFRMKNPDAQDIIVLEVAAKTIGNLEFSSREGL